MPKKPDESYAANDRQEEVGQSPQTPQDYTASTSSKQPAQDAWLTFRRAELDWAKSMHEAALSYQSQLAAAYASHQQAMEQILRDAWNEESAALEAAAQDAPSESADQTAERTAEKVQNWRASVASSRGRAYLRTGEAERKFTEDSQRAWLDFLGKQGEIQVRYLNAIGSAFQPGGVGQAPGVMVGDEGVDTAAQNAWVPWQGWWAPTVNMPYLY